MVTSEICDPNFFLNKERIKLMYREVTLMVIFLCGFFYMLHAVFNSEINLRDIQGVTFSTHYIFPLCLSLICFICLFYRFIKIYKNVVVKISLVDGVLIFNKLIFTHKIQDFNFDKNIDTTTWSYLDGFNRKYIHIIRLKDSGNRMFFLPFEEYEKEKLINFLLNYREKGSINLSG
ncbi:hypothetical protein [Acinetobacter sp. B51(2017)]|uniref:hypothetical protein n=1 Tax=Acinetobacter sp. B51(2017) TaxID=2060938 RepID=UPI000F0927A1|nr:hypothetical protein [Acinetobacter sp. B51(2017)]